MYLKSKVDRALQVNSKKISFEKLKENEYEMEVIYYTPGSTHFLSREKFTWTIGDNYLDARCKKTNRPEITFNRGLIDVFKDLVEIHRYCHFVDIQE